MGTELKALGKCCLRLSDFHNKNSKVEKSFPRWPSLRLVLDLPGRRGRPGYSPSRDGVGGGVDDQEAEDSVKPRRAHIPPAAFYTRRQPL